MKLLNIEQAAEYLKVAKSTLSREDWRQRTGVPFFRIGAAIRFDQDALDAWLVDLARASLAAHK